MNIYDELFEAFASEEEKRDINLLTSEYWERKTMILDDEDELSVFDKVYGYGRQTTLKEQA